jgi:predicted short-subunit dehydrogenase-like oxidoreductase (DUF2520 family)
MKRIRGLGEVAIFGAGKVGVGLRGALKSAGASVSLRPARAGLPARPYEAWLLVLAVRDRELGPLVARLVEGRLVGASTAVVHVAGALDAEVLAPLRAISAGVAQMHPMIAFASTSFTPPLAGGGAHVAGDAEAVRRGRLLCRAVGLRPRTIVGLDRVGYHAAAGLVANGAAALAAAGVELLELAGVPKDVAPLMLGPLLHSVAANVEAMGLPGALTGPVRRGDARGVEGHLATLSRLFPGAVSLYKAMAAAQLPLARRLGDAPAAAFDEIERVLARP